jgi:ABC-type nitrate/sulfonate/bicarbonate transport system substrate-binding protein
MPGWRLVHGRARGAGQRPKDHRGGETPGVGDAPLILAIQQGLFSRADLDVHITNYSSARAELNVLRAGAVDVAFGDYADMFYAQAAAAGQ